MRPIPASPPPQEFPARRLRLRAAGVLVAVFSAVAAVAADLRFTARDEALLDAIGRRGVAYFAEQSDPVSGLTRDRAAWADGAGPSAAPSSAAATGFALTAFCLGEERGWLPAGDARRRVLAALRTVDGRHAHERGWLYHFVDAASGARVWKSEASTVDTALFLQGALFAREYLRDPEVSALVDRIYRRIDWRWALNGGATLAHGWRPEGGFIPHRWDSYAEMMGLYLLGIGAPAEPLPASAWRAWRRGPWVARDGRRFIQCGPLFTH